MSLSLGLDERVTVIKIGRLFVSGIRRVQKKEK